MGELVIRITADGKVTVEGQGYKDASCLDAAKAFEAVLGKAGDRKLKPEAQVRAVAKTKVHAA